MAYNSTIDKATDDVLIYGNTVKDGSGTSYVPLVDADGQLQVDVLSSAIPTGASTSALQTTGNTSLSSLDTKLPAQGQALAAASTPVVLTAAQVTTLTPPAAITGFATSAKQDTQDTSINTLLKPASTLAAVTNLAQQGGVAIALNTGTRAAGVQRVTIATDDLVPVTGTITAVTAITNALPTGANAIGKLAANSGVDIGDVDILSIAAGDNNIGNVDIVTMPTVTVNAHAVTNAGTFAVQSVSSTTGGATPYKLISAATTNATSVKGSAGTLYSITASNINAAVRYLKIYDKASSPTVGTDVPKLVFAIPGATTGGGTNIPIGLPGVEFTLGIGIAMTTGAADADTGAVALSEIICNLIYK